MHDIAKKGHLKRLKKIAHCTFGLTVKQRQNKHINYLRYGVGAAGSESFQMCNELFFFMTFFGDIVHLIVRLSHGPIICYFVLHTTSQNRLRRQFKVGLCYSHAI
jgi:hypothetical protein